MLYLSFIYHMHQPYYRDLLTGEVHMPWVRLHGLKDYLDMVEILAKYPRMRVTFNLVPSLLEQVEDYIQRGARDNFLELSYKPAADLTGKEKEFILQNFFSINKERVISLHPRYYHLYLKKQANREFDTQDYLDLQVWFNLAWTDPVFRESSPRLSAVVKKGRFFSEQDKRVVLDEQLEIMKDIIPAYKRFILSGQIEVTISPFYHPILPLLFNTRIAREADTRAALPKINFSYPQDAQAQIDLAVKFYQERFEAVPFGMWPSEESVCEHILPFFIRSGIKWIVADEAILFKSLKKKKRDTAILYQPHLLSRKDGDLSIVFRDRNLSDLLGFVYYNYKTEDAVNDLMRHLENINKAFKDKDTLVVIAMDGENAWEYYPNDGHDFLNLLYQKLSDSEFITTTTVNDYLKMHPPKSELKRLAAGSWIYANFGKWIGNPYKIKAWEWLTQARQELDKFLQSPVPDLESRELATKQMYICEGSDWFWWYGEDPDGNFDRLFRIHLSNFYNIIGKEAPGYLKEPLRI